ncbi:sensor histidine kinase, partial [Spirochaeta dissipatitropha]
MNIIQSENMKSTAEKSVSRHESEYVAYLCHEIRGVLSGIIGYTDLLRAMPIGSIANEYIEYLWEGEQMLLETLNMAIDHSEFEIERIKLLNECVSTERFISEVIHLVRPLAYRKAIELKSSFLSKIPEFILTDPIRLRQIILNLINNAIKYTESGRVKLNISYEEININSGNLHFTISDTGPGVPMSEMPRLMQAFQRNSSNTQGTGLGLYIATRLIDIFGGDIYACSTEISDNQSSNDHGTCFSFHIPV